jgi:hypothetical protein
MDLGISVSQSLDSLRLTFARGRLLAVSATLDRRWPRGEWLFAAEPLIAGRTAKAARYLAWRNPPWMGNACSATAKTPSQPRIGARRRSDE